MQTTSETKRKIIAIIGCGQVGRSWAMLFASRDYQVNLYDTVNQQTIEAKRAVKLEFEKLEKAKLLRGKRSAKEQTISIQCHDILQDCLRNVMYIVECITESAQEKRSLYSKLEKMIGKSIIIASSTSLLQPSDLSFDMNEKDRFIVAHPISPSYFIPLVELIIGKWTSELTIVETKNLMIDIGQSPIVLKKEIPGFAVNRIQYQVLCECWNLVYDGVVDVQDIDKIMTEGIGMKYAFLGPFEELHLKADGIESFFELYGKTIHCLSQTFTPARRILPSEVENFAKHYNNKLPLDNLSETREWRNSFLRKLWNMKKQFKKAIGG